MNRRRRLPRRAMIVSVAAILAFAVLSGVASGATVVELTGGVTPGFSANMQPNAITTGPDGNIWFTESAGSGGVARVNPNGSVTELIGGVTPGLSANMLPNQITTGPDGNIWFTESADPGGVARVNSDGTVTEFRGGATAGFSANAGPEGIATGPDGNIWFTEPFLGEGQCSGGLGECGGLARLNGDGTVSQFEAGHNLPGMTPYTYANSITAGPDGNLWFTEPNLIRNNVIVTGVGRLNLGFATVTEFPAGTTPGFTLYAQPQSITSGSGGHVWFSELGGDGGIAEVNGDGSVTEFGDGTPGYVCCAHPNGIAQGSDGNMWFTQSVNPGLVGRLNHDGSITELTAGSTVGFSANGHPNGIVTGPDGNVWFTEGANPGRVAFVATAPTVTTGAASGVGASSATLNGSVNPRHTTVSDCHFDFGTSSSYGTSAPCEQAVGGGTIPVGVSVDLGPGTPSGSLSPATTYHFRVVATNPGGTSYGADQTFTTPAAPPMVSTGQAVSVGQSSANLTGTVNPGGAGITNCHFDYGTSGVYGNVVPCAQAIGGGTAPVSVSAAVAGLLPGRIYHFQLVATSSIATTHGGDQTFTTLAPAAPGAPLVTTGAASNIGRTTVTLTGTVNPRGSVTTYHFDYGASTTYGMSIPVPDAAAGSDTTTHPLSEPVGGLAPGTTYHFRLIASNSSGTSRAADVTFTTLPSNPGVAAPVLSALKMTPGRFSVGARRGSRVAAKRPAAGTTISYRDSTSATATLTIDEKVWGVAVGQRCVTTPRRARTRTHRCRRTVVVARILHADQPGANRLRFTGWVAAKKFSPGRYTLLVVASNDGGSSRALTARFTIVGRTSRAHHKGRDQ